MLNIANNQGSANPNHSEITSHRRMTVIKKTKGKCGRRLGEKCTVGGHVNLCSHYGYIMEVPQKLKVEVQYDSQMPLLGVYLGI